MDYIYQWITERHPLDARRIELFKLSQERGELMVAYYNRISDLANECKLNEITQQEIMVMIFICGCRSTRFCLDLQRQGEGIMWQFIKQQHTGWDRASRCKEQNGNNKALAKVNKASQQQCLKLSQAKNHCQANPNPKREKAEAFLWENADDVAARIMQ